MPERTTRPHCGRVALVTGSGQNIGRAIALALARQGADVVINGRHDHDKIDAVAEEARAEGVRALAVLADVGDPVAVQRMVDLAEAELGGIDIAISNVSVRLHKPFLDITIEEWNGVLNANLSAAFYLARCVLPHMQRRGWGRIIHISGRDGFTPIANRAHNVTCKAGMFALSKAIALEFGRFGITANTVAPGIIETSRDSEQYPDFVARYEKRRLAMPVQRFGTVDEVADACCYLAGEEAGFVTGQVLHINGGEFMF